MASQKSLDALKAANEALQDMQRHMEPLFDRLLDSADTTTTTTPRQRALAQAGIALALGTVRFMEGKLRIGGSKRKSSSSSSSNNNPASKNSNEAAAAANSQLRSDLNHMRKLLVQVRQQKSQSANKKSSSNVDKPKVESSTFINRDETKPKESCHAKTEDLDVASAATAGDHVVGEISPTSAAKRKESPTSADLASLKRRRK